MCVFHTSYNIPCLPLTYSHTPPCSCTFLSSSTFHSLLPHTLLPPSRCLEAIITEQVEKLTATFKGIKTLTSVAMNTVSRLTQLMEESNKQNDPVSSTVLPIASHNISVHNCYACNDSAQRCIHHALNQLYNGDSHCLLVPPFHYMLQPLLWY